MHKGSDTGGSIRTPAAFCGLFGHKATAGTVSVHGCDTVDPPSDFVSQVQVCLKRYLLKMLLDILTRNLVPRLYALLFVIYR